MKAYLITSGTLFAIITVLHIWEIIDRHRLVVEDPIVVLVAAGLAIWGWRLALTRT